MRITTNPLVLVLGSALLFGAAILIAARLLPTDEPRAWAVVVSPEQPKVLTPVADTPTPAPASMPSASAIEPAPGPRMILHHRPLEHSLVDRNGNPPKRDVTPAELARMAAGYGVIIDDLRGQPDGTELSYDEIAALHRMNPHISIVRPLETLTSNDPAHAGIAPDDGTHESWFLRDAHGDFVSANDGVAAWNGDPDYALDPASIGVRNQVAARARQYGMLGYDTVWLTGVAATLPRFSAPPIERATGALYTDATWQRDVAGVIDHVRRVAPDIRIVLDADAILAEHAHGIVISGGEWTDGAAWSAAIDAHAQVVAAEKVAFVIDSGDADRTLFALASFLLMDDGSGAFGVLDAASETYPPVPPIDPARLGSPLGPARIEAGVWLREYEGGVVAVNPTGETGAFASSMLEPWSAAILSDPHQARP